MSKHLGYIIEQLKRLSSPTHLKFSDLFFSLLDHSLYDAKDKEKNILYEWWAGFWRIIGAKLENFSRDHIQQFLDYTFNSKDMSFISILLVSYSKHPQDFN